MTKLFRRVRYGLINQNKTGSPTEASAKVGKYLKYAIGEIILVVIGILIALQINNWNENNKLHSVERHTYKNLLSSLRKDSLELTKILDYQTKSLLSQNRFIKSDKVKLDNTVTIDSLNSMLFNVYAGAYSFFPKYGTYNSITSNNGLDIISSENIKSNLIDLYDYQCSKYEFVDKALDEKYMNEFIPFLHKEMGFFVDSDLEYKNITLSQFTNKYEDLQLECQNLNPMSSNSFKILKNIQNKVNYLIGEIESELKK